MGAIFSFINFFSLSISLFLFSYLYLLSIQPVKRSYKQGEKAWKEAKILRSFSGLFELISVINILLWIWFPLPIVDFWIVNQNILVGIAIAIIIAIPCLIIMFKGIKDAGSETLRPSKETQMYGGIYNHIRHPQTVGEFPLFIAFGFLVNSWFLILIFLIYLILFIPLMIFYEEKDLIRRFGEKYIKYKESTGCLFPILKKFK